MKESHVTSPAGCKEWYYRGIEGRLQGPLNWSMIEILVEAGVIRPDTPVKVGVDTTVAHKHAALAGLFCA